MKRLFLLFITVASLGFASSSLAQVTARMEISRDADTDRGRIIPMGDRGVLRQSFLKKKEKGKNVFRTMMFDTDLKLVHCDSIVVERNMSLNDTLSYRGVYYSLLRDNRDNFSLVRFDPKTKAMSTINGKFKKKASMRNLVMNDKYMVFSSTEKKLDRLGIINLSTGECRYTDMHFKGIRDQNIYILDNVIIDGKIHALVRMAGDVVLMRFDFNGDFVGQPAILTTNITNHHILTASLSKAGGHYFVTGTYTDKERGDATRIAQGIYFGQFNGEAFTFIKFYNFFDLKNFTQYMSEKGQEKIERNKEKAEKKGETFSKDYSIVSHDIVEQGGNYYYIGEAYYPVYSMGSGGFVYLSRVIAGYNYTHGFIIKFDREGNVLWDNCFPIKLKRLVGYIKHFINARFSSSQVNALYAYEDKLVSKTFDANSGVVIKDRSEEPLQTDNEDEKVKDNNNVDVDYWYGNNFLIFGDQLVKNESTKERRKVYYINKFTVDN